MRMFIIFLSLLMVSHGLWAQSQVAEVESLIKDRYRDHGDGTVTDIQTNLQWMRCLIGQEWHNGRCQGRSQEWAWDDAQKLKIDFAGHSNWRFPTIEELRGLVYCSSGKPAYFPNNGGMCEGGYQSPTLVREAFPDASRSFVWSSSPVAGYPDYAWSVNFNGGGGNYYGRVNNGHVRLVRVGPTEVNITVHGKPLY
ncbi:DUF1566 domain-containing protein [Thioflexithrix psekupsensis]|uniref:Lcl C-terminal domain-containing protein n=1 Tax=Thioflexithrix psekupsensis TaxID=1570016 RepID=A0A251X971_9GAMM|nr:DUF1566 domain-containing protein [Thioflexithrix psekupsensis]OUD14485.1 hypothetical protein TPSD3_09290 [Thioflexithrix psekupsensis]